MNLFETQYGKEFCDQISERMAMMEQALSRASEQLELANQIIDRQSSVIAKQTETILAMRETMDTMPSLIAKPIVEQLTKANESLEKGNELNTRIIHIERQSLAEAKEQTATQRASFVLDAMKSENSAIIEQSGISMEQQSSILKGAQDWFSMAMPQQADKQHEEVLRSIISDEEMAMAKAEGGRAYDDYENDKEVESLPDHIID